MSKADLVKKLFFGTLFWSSDFAAAAAADADGGSKAGPRALSEGPRVRSADPRVRGPASRASWPAPRARGPARARSAGPRNSPRRPCGPAPRARGVRGQKHHVLYALQDVPHDHVEPPADVEFYFFPMRCITK